MRRTMIGVALLTGVLGLAACEERGRGATTKKEAKEVLPGEQTNRERAAKAGEEVKEGAEKTGETVREGAKDAREGLREGTGAGKE